MRRRWGMRWILGNFSIIAFVFALAICVGVAALIAWLSNLNFWIILAILVCALLFNGLVAGVEDGSNDTESKVDPPG
jgi:choline-glycine betaine transporter